LDSFGNAGGYTLGIAYLLNANAGAHNLTWASQTSASQAVISEWNGITATGGTVVQNSATSNTTITSSSYTPSQANEVVFATQVQAGTGTTDGNRCTTAGFQLLGPASDAGSKPCIGINQNGAATASGEANAQIVTSAAALTATWTWTTAASSAAIVGGGFKYTPASGPVLMPWQQLGGMGAIMAQ
jgi:hypothetical protein